MHQPLQRPARLPAHDHPGDRRRRRGPAPRPGPCSPRPGPPARRAAWRPPAASSALILAISALVWAAWKLPCGQLLPGAGQVLDRRRCRATLAWVPAFTVSAVLTASSASEIRSEAPARSRSSCPLLLLGRQLLVGLLQPAQQRHLLVDRGQLLLQPGVFLLGGLGARSRRRRCAAWPRSCSASGQRVLAASSAPAARSCAPRSRSLSCHSSRGPGQQLIGAADQVGAALGRRLAPPGSARSFSKASSSGGLGGVAQAPPAQRQQRQATEQDQRRRTPSLRPRLEAAFCSCGLLDRPAVFSMLSRTRRRSSSRSAAWAISLAAWIFSPDHRGLGVAAVQHEPDLVVLLLGAQPPGLVQPQPQHGGVSSRAALRSSRRSRSVTPLRARSIMACRSSASPAVDGRRATRPPSSRAAESR